MLLDPEAVPQSDSRSSYYGWRQELFLTAALVASTQYEHRWNLAQMCAGPMGC